MENSVFTREELRLLEESINQNCDRLNALKTRNQNKPILREACDIKIAELQNLLKKSQELRLKGNYKKA